MYDKPFTQFVNDLQNIVDQKGWTGKFDQQALFNHLYHNGYQYILKPEAKPNQFEWRLGLTYLTVGIGDRSLITPTDRLGLVPGNTNIHGFTGFEENYDHRLTYLFVLDDASKSGSTYVVAMSFSPLIPK